MKYKYPNNPPNTQTIKMAILYSNFKNERIKKGIKPIKETPAQSPSIPSVKLTAFVSVIYSNDINGTNTNIGRLILELINGTKIEHGTTSLNKKNRITAKPNSITSLVIGDKPSFLFVVIINISSINPTEQYSTKDNITNAAFLSDIPLGFIRKYTTKGIITKSKPPMIGVFSLFLNSFNAYSDVT